MKYKYNINNLDCPMCAKRIEDSLNKLEYLSNVSINFNTKKISFETKGEVTLKDINSLIKDIEKDVYISEYEIDKEYHLLPIILGVFIFLIGYFINNNSIKLILYIISYIILLYKTLFNSIKLLIKSKCINENFLVTISSIGAFLIGKYSEGVMVVSLYLIGKMLEEKAVNSTRRSVSSLIDLKEDYVSVKVNNKLKKVRVEEVKKDEVIVVKKGEKIGLDGIVIDGNGFVDTSSLTGESKPYEVNINDSVMSGSINLGDTLTIRVTNIYEDSTVSKILDLLESATDKKTKTETIVSKISKVYTPSVLLISILFIIILPFISNLSMEKIFYRALSFLVISCPCAIMISIPLSYFTSIGVSSKNGILVKGSNYLDVIANIKNIIFDKTGTLTTGEFSIDRINIYDESYNKEEILNILYIGESLSTHPIAYSLVKDKSVDTSKVTNFKEEVGSGISFNIDGYLYFIGNDRNCSFDGVHVHKNGIHIASIKISDTIKDNSKHVISELKKKGITTYMFTGDNRNVSKNVSNLLGIDKFISNMLPIDKYNEYIRVNNKGLSMFVGDGVNDAPILKLSTVGVSMGKMGSDVSVEASDIVIMNDDLSKIILLLDISKYTRKIIIENLVFSLLIKLSVLVLSMLGLTNMYMAVLADTGLTLLTILNTFRIFNKFKNK